MCTLEIPWARSGGVDNDVLATVMSGLGLSGPLPTGLRVYDELATKVIEYYRGGEKIIRTMHSRGCIELGAGQVLSPFGLLWVERPPGFPHRDTTPMNGYLN
jgi:hypothetical protein